METSDLPSEVVQQLANVLNRTTDANVATLEERACNVVRQYYDAEEVLFQLRPDPELHCMTGVFTVDGEEKTVNESQIREYTKR